MKKKLLLAALLIVGSIAYSNDFEVKLGADLFRDTTRDQYDDKTTSLDPGYSIGAEYIIETESNLKYGLGTEYKSEIKGNHSYSAHSTVPVYLLGRYGLENDYYLVGRLGWALNNDEGDDIKSTEDGAYVALGVGKELTDRINLELFYEGSDYEYETSVDKVDGWYNVVSLKFGIKLGNAGEKLEEAESAVEEVAMVEEPAPVVEEEIYLQEEAVPAAEEVIVQTAAELKKEPMVEVPASEALPEKYITGFSIRPMFGVNDSKLNPSDIEEIKKVSDILKGQEGTLILIGHTDNIGAEAYNLTLSKKRADAVKAEFEMHLTGENIEIIADGMGEDSPVADNSTENGRAENRRVEVKFEPKTNM